MKQYDLTGLQGEVSNFGAYFVFLFFAAIATIAVFTKIYGLAIGVVILAFIFYYFLFVKKKKLKRIFFDEQNLFVESEKIPLISVIKITDFGVIKYLDGNVTKTLTFVNYPIQKPNLKLLKEFHRKACSVS